LKAEIASLKADLESKASAEVASEQAKVVSICTAVEENKVTFAQAKELFVKASVDVSAHLAGLESNASGYGKKGVPSVDAIANVFDQYQAMEGSERTNFFAEHKEEIIKQMNKEN